MEPIAPLLKLLHLTLAMALTAGVVGRWIVLHRAAESRELNQTIGLLETAAPFEWTTRASSMLILPAGLLTAWAQGYDWLGLTTGWMIASTVIYVALFALVPTVFLPAGRRFEAALVAARQAGAVTHDLDAAFADSRVRGAHVAELAGFGVIVALMVLKPF